MNCSFTVFSGLIVFVIVHFSIFTQEVFSQSSQITITHSVNPDSVFLSGALACRSSKDSLTAANHYWRSFVLADFEIAADFNVTSVDIGIQEAVGGNGGLQPMTCNLYITDGTAFPGGYPNSLTVIGSTTLEVPDQAGTHFPIDITGIVPAGSELVVEIYIPFGAPDGNKFFMGINDLGESAPSYWFAPVCGVTFPIPSNPPPPGIVDQNYVMSVTGDTTTTLGIEDEIKNPAKIFLNQNYPNPFNPTTIIEYSIPKSGYVNLIVYDIMGREVAVLVDEQKSTGIYKAEFNAVNLSGGVYFYQIKANGFIQTNRMLLLK